MQHALADCSDAVISDAAIEVSEASTMESKGTMEQVLTAMAASVMHSASGMSKWNMADLTLGIYKLSGRHQLEGAVDTIVGVPLLLP